jgi:sugar/nucleoside kinase (ribokinase family)
MFSHPAQMHLGRGALITVGQLSCDTTILLDRPLAARDHNAGAAHSMPGGTAAIVAHNVAALGGSATFCGQVGDGVEDRAAARALREAGVELGPLVTAPSGLRVVIVVEPDGERTMFATGGKPTWSTLDMRVRRGDIVFFEGWHLLGKSPDADYISLIKNASNNGATVALDVCSASNASAGHGELLRGLPIDILLANAAEAEALDLLSKPPVSTVVVHRGCEPTLLIDGDERRDFPVDVVTPVDTTGAGDTFAAGLLHSLHHSADIHTAVRRGLAAARAVVRVPGPLLPSAGSAAIPTESIAV